MNFEFWLNFVYFFVALFISWYIPGRVVLGKVKLNSNLALFTLSTILGLVLWGWQGYLFGYIKIRSLSYVYLVVFLILWLKEKNNYFQELKLSIKKIDIIFFIILILGIFSQNIMTWGSGLLYHDGIRIYDINSLDGVLHLAYIEQIIKNIPPEEPGFSGEIIRNYHYWSNMVVGEIDRVFNIPVINSFFQYSNIFLSLFLGLSAYSAMLIFSGSKTAARWFCFFLLLAGDFGYITMILVGKGLSFNIPSIDNAAIFLQNPPRAYSVIVLLGSLIAFFSWLKNKNKRLGIIIALLMGSAVGFKVYTGILGLSALSFFTLYHLIKKDWKNLYILPLAIIFSLIVYLPNNSSAGGLVFTPFEWPINFLTQGGLNMGEWELRRRTYIAEFNSKRVLQMELMMTALFLFSQWGIKILGFFYVKKVIKKYGLNLSMFFYGSIITVTLAGLLFIQKSGGFNVFNFFVAAAVFLSFLTSLLLSDIKSKINSKLVYVIYFIVIILVIPRVINENMGILKEYFFGKTYTLVSNEELEAYKYIQQKTNKNSLILTLNKGTYDDMTPYVSFFTKRTTFFSGMGEMRAHDIDFKERQKTVEEITSNLFNQKGASLLKNNKISYILLPAENISIPKTQRIPFPEVFKNSKMKIYKIK